MPHIDPHFETADGLQICECMCEECFSPDADEGDVACICPECDHHLHTMKEVIESASFHSPPG